MEEKGTVRKQGLISPTKSGGSIFARTMSARNSLKTGCKTRIKRITKPNRGIPRRFLVQAPTAGVTGIEARNPL